MERYYECYLEADNGEVMALDNYTMEDLYQLCEFTKTGFRTSELQENGGGYITKPTEDDPANATIIIIKALN